MSPFSTQQQHTQQEGPDISLLEPALQKQWDHDANARLGNTVFKPYSRKEVWWTCEQCPDGHPHSWSARVSDRTRGSGCPQCSSRKVCKHNSLATKAPGVAAQWDYEENDGTPDSVVAHSSRLVCWFCIACGHKWSATPNSRVSKTKPGCPGCAKVASTKKHTKHPTFAECQDPEVRALLGEWDHMRNAAKSYFPHNTRLRSHKKIDWLCTKCPAGQEHRWSAQPRHRTSHHKTGCPVCAGKAACKCNSLQALYPAIAAEWDYSKNKGQPSGYPASSNYLAWWSSPQRGSWQQTITSRTYTVYQRTAGPRRVQERQAANVSSRTDNRSCLGSAEAYELHADETRSACLAELALSLYSHSWTQTLAVLSYVHAKPPTMLQLFSYWSAEMQLHPACPSA